MSDDHLSDRDAKEIMEKWPRTTTVLFGGTDDCPWVKAQPKHREDSATTPLLLIAGNTALKTQPDGMYIRLVNDMQSLDVICFEVCSSLSNLQDKRSRYAPSISSLVVDIKNRWWNEKVYSNGATRWKKMPFDEYEMEDHVRDDEWFPIRHLRVVYVLRSDHLENFRLNGVGYGHEYFIRNRSLASISAQGFRSFLDRLSPNNHFYTQ